MGHGLRHNELPAVPVRRESRLFLALAILASAALWFVQGLWIWRLFHGLPAMGFNRRKMESERAAAAAKEAEGRRALGPQILADGENLGTRGKRRTCRPHAPFAELVRVSPRSIADEMREEHRALVMGE
jgi:hypothetical protein